MALTKLPPIDLEKLEYFNDDPELKLIHLLGAIINLSGNIQELTELDYDKKRKEEDILGLAYQITTLAYLAKERINVDAFVAASNVYYRISKGLDI